MSSGNDEPTPLERIVEAMSRAAPVDWKAEQEASPELEPVVPTLQELERIISAHRVTAPGEPQEPAGPEPPTPEIWGPLQVREHLATGSFAEVFRAFDPRLECEVALKLIRTDRVAEGFESRFLDEARRLARVRHENVLVVHGADQHDERPGLWTDLVHGRTLEEILASHGTFAAHEAAGIGIALCRALAAVHRAGLVHGDVKAANVIREDGGRVVLMDFGAARDLATREQLWHSGQGSPLSMAPEQVRGEPATVASDLYAVGALLYRMVTGQHPIEAPGWNELRDAHEHGRPKPLLDLRPDVPAEFARVIERALSASPAARFASAGAMERALAESVGSGPTNVTPLRGSLPGGGIAWIVAAVALVLAGWFVMRAVRHGRSRSIPVAALSESAARAARDSSNTAASLIATSQPLQAVARLFRTRGAAHDSLAWGAGIQPGDDLDLDITPREKMYVYVFDRDEARHAFALFPMPGLDRLNPLSASAQRLPGSLQGRTFHWRVSSPGGRERIVAIGSRQPIPELEQAILQLPRPRVSRPGAPRDSTTVALRGVGEVVEEPAPASAAQLLSDLLDRYRGRAKRDHALWLWEMELSGPRPS